MIVKKITSGPLKTNTFIVVCMETKDAAVIDPSSGSFNEILKFQKQEKISIGKILLTHSHLDHFADAFQLKEHTQAILYVHEKDKANLIKPGSDGIGLFMPVKSAIPDFLLQGDEEIFVGKLSFQVIHTPGHSPGSVCFYVGRENSLFSGDTLFRGTIGNLDLATANADDMWNSLLILSRLSSDTIVFPGHGKNTTIGAEAWLKNAKEFFG